MRDLSQVLKQIIDVAPELEVPLVVVTRVAPYTPPEQMGKLWRMAAGVLTIEAPDREDLKRIFSGE